VLIRHYAGGKFHRIACPEGSRVVRRSDRSAPGGGFLPDRVVVPFGGAEIPIPAVLPELLPLLAESGRYGLALAGEPEPDARLAGSTYPACGEDDVNWLVLDEDGERVHCDGCGADFDPSRDGASAASSLTGRPHAEATRHRSP
jgi:hypothetical protein